MKKATMALAPYVASKKVYGANLPHESAQVGEDKFHMEKDENLLDWCA